MAFISSAAFSKPLILTSTPDLKWLVEQITQDFAEVDSLLSGEEDVHYMEALPSFVIKASNADMVCFMGLSLEAAWLPKVIQKSANSQIQSGAKGNCDASKYVEVEGKIEGGVDRSMGDVHAEGNPHYQLSPRQMSFASQSILETLAGLYPEKSAEFQSNHQKLKSELNQLSAELQELFQQLPKSASFMEYHKDFIYFFKEFSLKSWGAVEELPGVAPSAAFLAGRAEFAKKQKVSLVLTAKHHPVSYMKQFQKLSQVPYIAVNTSLTDKTEIQGYAKFLRNLSREIVHKINLRHVESQ